MGISLEIKSGPLAGQRIPVRAGQTFLIGRAAERAQFAVPHDSKMSGVHFVVECGTNGCRVIDKKSTNGTFLNGARIKEAVLANGDEIESGQTIFVVRIVPDGQLSAPTSSPIGAAPKSPAHAVAPTDTANAKSSTPFALALRQTGQPHALVIGNWAFQEIPEGWQIKEGLGIQQVVKDAFPAGIAATEEPLGPGTTLVQYVEAHTKMLEQNLPEPKIVAGAPPAIRGAEEIVALEIRFTFKDGPAVCWRRVYARSGSTIGVLMLTTLEKDLSSVQPSYDSVLSAISFSPRH
jgi:FHA domain